MSVESKTTEVSSSTEQQDSRLLGKDFIFIFGSGRCGTTWLQAMMGCHPQVATTVQMTVFYTYIPDWLESWKWETRFTEDSEHWDVGLPVVWTEDEFVEFLRDFIARVYSRVMAKNPNATHILDKHGEYRNHLDAINKFIPHARFIHMVRDGRDVALSLKAAKDQWGWGSSSVPEAIVDWKQFVEESQQGAKFGDRFLEVKYEDLYQDGESVLRDVFEFCGLPVKDLDIADIVKRHTFEQMKANLASPDPDRKAPAGHYRHGKAGSWREELTPMQKYLIDFYAADTLKQYGYYEDNWWYDSQLQKFYAPLLAHSFRVLRRIGRTWRLLRQGK